MSLSLAVLAVNFSCIDLLSFFLCLHQPAAHCSNHKDSASSTIHLAASIFGRSLHQTPVCVGSTQNGLHKRDGRLAHAFVCGPSLVPLAFASQIASLTYCPHWRTSKRPPQVRWVTMAAYAQKAPCACPSPPQCLTALGRWSPFVRKASVLSCLKGS
eukprot:138493-Pelagomonas_calceolata.AAC.2